MNKVFRKIRDNFWFDAQLLKSNIELTKKISYLIRRYFCIFLNKREIDYFGSYFYYDNRFSPALLQTYPLEIEELNEKINFNALSSVMDIGANIGQFSYTLKKLHPNLEVHVFEPNKKIFDLLKKNLSVFKGAKAFNLGLGPKNEKRTLYFSPEASPEGSFYKENLSQNYNRKNIEEIKIETINPTKDMIKKLGLKERYDLIKIDVEGAELEVLKSLKNISTKYLFVEVSLGRTGGNLKEVCKIIGESLKSNPKIISYKKQGEKVANVLFELE